MADYTSKNSVKNLPSLLQKVTVMVVDPDPLIANIIKYVLGNLGFGSIVIEHNSKSAAETFVAKTIDFIITDFDETLIDEEYTFIEFIRNSPESPNPYVPIILLTGHTEKHDIETARDQGVTEIAAKPFTAKSLCNRIIQVIENPRSFIITKRYTGPDRRRRREDPPPNGNRREADAKGVKKVHSPSFFKRLLGKTS
jgi:CheY-like chemotaxis protein